MKKQQQGFALAISLILMIILTFLGFNIANRGKLTSQVIRTSSQYDAISAAAEAEMYRLMNALSKTEERIEKGEETILMKNGDKLTSDDNLAGKPADEVAMVWDSQLLAKQFGNEGLPVFSDYRAEAWDLGIVSQVNMQSASNGEKSGAIRTRSFIQELIIREISSDVERTEIEVQYLVTTKAYYVQDPDTDATADLEKESIVIQSLTRKSFVL